MEVAAFLMFAGMVAIIASQHFINQKINKINAMLERQIECDRKMLDDLSILSINLTQENAELKMDNSNLLKRNSSLEDKISKINEQLANFSKLFKA